MKQCVNLYKNHKEIILYLVFGVLTTILNIVTFWLCNDILHIDYKMSNAVAWILSVVFAFITNKTIVFESKNKSQEETAKEATSFVLARLISLIIDMALMIFMIDILKINSLISKIIVNIVVVVINYIFSKFIIFRK